MEINNSVLWLQIALGYFIGTIFIRIFDWVVVLVAGVMSGKKSSG